ncbi:peroxiredoxin-like family protein [Cupriavidus necator]|uniref:peroxiredoxin-like family protein n=1 Tax=Cupriavidus necator TaxID=106590 RepID=UPI0005B4574D|nr:peroxiredoxin-like family protein [Cupriavidus necator]
MTLQDKLDAFKADFRAGKAPYFAPPEVHAVMVKATNELIASGLAERALKAGDVAPAFELEDGNGQMVSSSKLLKEGPLVVCFYRGVWCPCCNIELPALEEAFPSFKAEGASLVAISPQTPANSRKSARDWNISFPILSDAQGRIAAAFGVRHDLPSELIELYSRLAINLPALNNDSRWTLPMPARYVINRDGRILYSEINPDYTVRPEPTDVLPVLRRSRASP